MALTFADTHNMIAHLTKSDASEGFEQILDFLNASVIQYALTEIFAELARMGYEKPSTKLTFYKAFFLAQLKFLIHTILQCMSAKRTMWNEFSSSMASAGRKGISRVDTPLFEGMLVPQEAADDVEDVVVDDVIADDVVDVVTHSDVEPTPPSPTHAITPPPSQELPSTSQEIREEEKVESFWVEDIKEGRLEESQAQVYHIDLEHADKVLSMQDDELEPAKLKKVIEVVTTAKLMTEVVTTAAAPINAATITAAPKLEEEASRALKRKTKSSEQQAAKKQKLDEEVEELKNIYKLFQMMKMMFTLRLLL
uniref:Synaptobrevin, longin-like domain protein n=1 Tax=Tanacetum cinerariifolium TaxID=118510 RepID=A0A6L2JI83_TANCI|nr:hypothetical protein [Tanacetum cinerariifolium]